MGKQPGTILVIDDDPEVRQCVGHWLRAQGFAVEVAGNGREGLDRLRSGGVPPCVVLLDLRMPVVDGWQFLRERAVDPTLWSVPVVVVSSERNAAEALAMGAASVLPSPFRLRDLANEIWKHRRREDRRVFGPDTLWDPPSTGDTFAAP